MRKKIIAILTCIVLVTAAIVITEAKSVISEKNLIKSDELIDPTLAGDYNNITVAQAWELLTNTSNGIQIPIDVRTDSEWVAAHIDTPYPENANHWPNLHTGEKLSEFMELYQGKEIILYCKSGSRSKAAAILLVANNFDGIIYNMLGGIDSWTQAGYPTKANSPPNIPTISGEKKGNVGQEYQYTLNSTDIDQDDIYYYVNWSDGTPDQLVGLYHSGQATTLSHIWSEKGTYTIKVKARDKYNAESDWGLLTVTMPYSLNVPFMQFLIKIFERFPHAFPIIQHLMGY